jgi:hypothetical protein
LPELGANCHAPRRSPKRARRSQLLAFGCQGHAQLLLNLLAVGKANVLGNVCLHGGHDLWGPGVLANQLHHDRVLHGHRVHLNVGLMVLILERL